MNGDRVGLKFIMGGGYIIVVTSRQEAERVITQYRSQELTIIGNHNVWSPPDAPVWAINAIKVDAIHTVDLGNLPQPAVVQQPPYQPSPGTPFTSRSGYNLR